MHVYVLEAPHGCKIGRSTNPTARLRNLETQGGFAAGRSWVSLPTDYASDLERAAHAALSEYRGRGEWFDVEFDHAVTAVCTASEAFVSPNAALGTVSARLKLALSARKTLTQSGIASACGISDAAVSQWISGSTANIRPENLFSAADYLGVSARWLATGSDHIHMTRSRLGAAIARLSEHQFRSSKAFAGACGIDAGNMSRYLSGQQDIPLEKMNAIASVLGIPLSAIYVAAEQSKP